MKRSVDAIRFSGAGLYFGAAAIMALISAGLVFAYLRSAVDTADVVVVATDLPPGTTLTERDLKVQSIPTSAVPEHAIRTREEAVGTRARYGLTAGDIVRSGHLVAAGSDMAHRLAQQGPEYRMVMLPGELIPARDRLVAGDRLELTAVLPLQDQQLNTSVTVPLGTVAVLDVPATAGSNDEGVVLVALESQQVPTLALTLRQGTLLVSLVGVAEVSPQASPVRLDSLTAQAGKVAPANPMTSSTAAMPKPPQPPGAPAVVSRP